MGLINLQTKFKDLKFGNDTLGGGSSGQPYIVTPIPERANALQNIKISAAGMSYDFPVRGGALAVANGIEDTIRIGKFFLDSPRGPLFLAKQVGLQLSNPKIETGKVIGLENTRLYNVGVNTLAQIPVNAFGIHFDRHGLLPTVSDKNKYEYVVTQKNINTPEDNRLVQLYQDKIFTDDDSQITKKINEKIKALENKVKNFTTSRVGKFLNSVTGNLISNVTSTAIQKIKRTLNPKYYIIDSYLGGPNSVYGIGSTTINRYVFSEDPRTENYAPETKINYYGLLGASLLFPYELDAGLNEIDPSSTPSYLAQTSTTDKTQEIINSIDFRAGAENNSHLNSISYNYDLIIQQKIANAESDFVGLIGKDFREVINNKLGKLGTPVLPSTDYSKYNMMTRIGIGNPGKINRDRTRINIDDADTQDKINMIPLFKEDINDAEGGTVVIDGKKHSTRDLIKFRFEAVDNDNPNKTVKIVFRAFISEFADNYNADWQSHKYVGRGENFYTYQGFTRQISLGFKIAAQSRSEMKPLYQKLNYLVSNTMPDYQANGFMRGPYMLLTIGSWLYRTPIIINSLNLGVNDNYPWEIAMNQPEGGDDSTMAELPQVLNIGLNITPIHNFIPRKGPTVPFINTGTHDQNNWLKSEEFTNIL